MPFDANGGYTDEFNNFSGGGGGLNMPAAMGGIQDLLSGLGQQGGGGDPFANIMSTPGGGGGRMGADPGNFGNYAFGPGAGSQWTPMGVPQGAHQSTIFGPGGNQNQQWNWQDQNNSYATGMTDLSRLSPMERMAGLSQGGAYNSMPGSMQQLMQLISGGPQGVGGGGGLEQLFQMLGNQGQMQIGPHSAISTMPGTYNLPGAQGIQGNNPFQGDISGANGLDRLAALTGGQDAIPNFLRTMFNGEALGAPSNMNNTLMQLGQMQGTPSPQSINNMNPSENQFMQGFMESIMGIPWNDILNASYQPFQGLSSARKPRRNYGTS